jgi:hypothetical protein
VPIEEPFGSDFDAKRFTTPILNKNRAVPDGVLWTHGSSGGKYPPRVYLPVEGTDVTLSFRYRHLADGGWLRFFVDGDDDFGSEDHLLREKLLRHGIQLQVDGHSKDPNHPQRKEKDRPADNVSGAYRLNESFPVEKADLRRNEWLSVQLVLQGEQVTLHVGDQLWSKTLGRPGFNATKRKLLWMQNGGEAGIELDDIKVHAATPQR